MERGPGGGTGPAAPPSGPESPAQGPRVAHWSSGRWSLRQRGHQGCGGHDGCLCGWAAAAFKPWIPRSPWQRCSARSVCAFPSAWLPNAASFQKESPRCSVRRTRSSPPVPGTARPSRLWVGLLWTRQGRGTRGGGFGVWLPLLSVLSQTHPQTHGHTSPCHVAVPPSAIGWWRLL